MSINAFTIGGSALSVGLQALNVIGQNIANANTPGYSLQRVNLANTTVGGKVGTGVTITAIDRYTAANLTTAKWNSASQVGAANARLASAQQVQTSLNTGSGGISDQLNIFFNDAAALTTNPSDPTSRQQFLTDASTLAAQFNSAAAALDNQKNSVGQAVDQSINQINTYTTQIANLNTQIANAIGAGNQPNDLLDQRDQLINKISQLVDVRVIPQPFGSVNLISGNTALVAGNFSFQLATQVSGAGQKQITTAGANPTVVTFNSGAVVGNLAAYNTDIPTTRSQLDTLAATFIQKVDQIQATGIPLTGPTITGSASRGVNDPTQPLSTQNLPIPVTAGTLVVSVTNSGTGTITNSTVAIDPATQSLNDIAAAITAATGGQVQATVTVPQNTLQLQAQSGYAFSFAGTPSNPPDTVNIGGTANPTVSGIYTGSANDTYTFQINGTGTIGTTPGLTLTVTNSAGNVVATQNVGQGYTPGTALAVNNGITVALTAGTTTNGTFTSNFYANPDTSGVLGAFGINGLFSGSSATDIAVRPDVLANPSKLATSTTGQPGDSSNITKIANLQNTPVIGNSTISGQYRNIASSVGAQVSSLNDLSTAQTNMQSSLFNQEQAQIGVNTNEEALQLLNYQRMVQAASQYLSVVNTALDSLFNITL